MSELKAKYKILLVIPREPGGVEYHRLLAPHFHIQKNYPEFEVLQIRNLDHVKDADLKELNTNIVIFNRIASATRQSPALLMRLKRLGIITICDIDDHWLLSQNHLLKKHFTAHNIPAQTVESLMGATHITCTHELLASQVPARSKKDITIVPNGIDPVGQFQVVSKTFDERVQFGWVGGACHEEDLRLLSQSMVDLHASNLPACVNLAGFSPDPVYLRYEVIMSGNRTSTPESYSRIPAQQVDRYAHLYDSLDVSLIPLNQNLFNNCKSNLKLLEAGFKKKAVICSDIHPYSSLLRRGVNGLAVNQTDNKRGWFKSIERYCKNRGMITDHAEQLYLDVQPYRMDKVNEIRVNLYKSLIAKHNV